MREAVQNLIQEEEDGGPEVCASDQAVVEQSQWHDHYVVTMLRNKLSSL